MGSGIACAYQLAGLLAIGHVGVELLLGVARDHGSLLGGHSPSAVMRSKVILVRARVNKVSFCLLGKRDLRDCFLLGTGGDVFIELNLA